ncbi:MAG: transcriptional regulator [Planctomycetaceae bacterium]|nr:transcriptional regulator [Planctomycetaceae bacterium]
MAELNNIIHQPVRLRIMAALCALERGGQMDFVYLKKMLNLTDGNLGAHLTKLEDVGFIAIEKTFVARKPRTFVCVTGKGHDAFNEHINALKQIIEDDKT